MSLLVGREARPLMGRSARTYREAPSASADLLILGHINAETDQLAETERITIQTAS